MKSIIIKCEVLYFATFRKPASTSLILTYSVPPFTTIRGMIANALGLPQHDYSLQDKIKIGIRLLHNGYKNMEMAKILKMKSSTFPRARAYPSSPMFKEYLVNPKYNFYVGGEENLMQKIHSSLTNLKRPLYIGQSDDLVDIEVSDLIDIEEEKLDETHSITEGIHQGCMIEKLPYAFSKKDGKYSVEYKIVSIPNPKTTIKCNGIGYKILNDNVILF